MNDGSVTLRFAEPVMCLRVGDLYKTIVNLLGGRLHFRQSCMVFFVRFQCGRFIAHLEVHVDQLVRERRELVAEARRIDTADL